MEIKWHRKRIINGFEFGFRPANHDEVCAWVSRQGHLRGTIHESFEAWVGDHKTFYKYLTGPHLWAVTTHGDEIASIFYSTLFSYPKFDPALRGLYSGFQIVDPKYRGLGLGRRLDEYRLFWTHNQYGWDYSWTGTTEELWPFNQKLGYDHIKKRESGIHLIWRYAKPEGYSFESL